MSFVWTDERVDQLTQMFKAGLTGSQAGRAFGLSRSAIIGKWNRLGLKRGRASAGPPKERRRKRTSGPRPHKARVIRMPPEPVLPPACDPITLMQLGLVETEHGQCRFPIGDPAGADTLFCGAKRERGAYCGWHANIAYRPAEERRRRAA